MLLVIGSTGGLGSGLLEYLRDHPEAAAAYGSIRGTVRSELDLQDAPSVTAFFERLAGEMDDLPLYVINAAGVSLNGLIHKQPLEEWRVTTAVNLESAFTIVQAAYPILRSRPGSSIALLSSVVGEIGVPGTTAYAATKAGLHGFVRSAARELARLQVTINCLDLGYFDRGMIKQVPASFLEQLQDEIPLGRLGSIADLFFACDFALRCGYVTGTSIKLNGGLT